MGIYDREYVRVGPRSTSGMGAMRMVSVNTWLIVINVAVFMLDALLASSGAAVLANVGTIYISDTPSAMVERAEPKGDPRPVGRVLAEAQFVSEDAARQLASKLSAATHVRRLVDPQTGNVVGLVRYAPMAPLQAFGHFSTGKGFFELQVWRLITFQFLHANLTHLLFNMIGLFFFGGLIENYLGGKRYLAFYLVCGLFGGIAYLLLNLIGQFGPALPGVLFNDIYTPLIGASAGVFGVLMAAAFVAPNAMVLVFFILPMRLATVVYVFVAIAALNLLLGGQNAGGDAAHLGGALAGAYFIRNTHLLHDFFDIFGSRKKAGGRARASGGGKQDRGRLRAAADALRSGDTPDDSEIDRILSKIATQGLHSLSEAEKRTLRRATEARRR